MPRNTSLAAVMAKFAQFIKGTPQDQLDDVADILDNADVSHGDLWNRGGAPMSQSESNTGPAERMSGGGVAQMIREYSNPNQPESAFAALGDRLESMERAIKAMMGVVFKSDGNSDEDDDESEETSKADLTREDDESFPNNASADGARAAKKSTDIATMTVAEAMSYITGRIETRKARAAKLATAQRIAKAANYMQVATPPDMPGGTALQKSGPSLKAIVESRLDNNDFMGGIEATNLRLLHGAINASERGLPGALERIAVLRSKLAI